MKKAKNTTLFTDKSVQLKKPTNQTLLNNLPRPLELKTKNSYSRVILDNFFLNLSTKIFLNKSLIIQMNTLVERLKLTVPVIQVERKLTERKSLHFLD